MKLKILTLLACLFAGGHAQAQQPWTFDQVLQSALDSHPTIMGKRSAQTAARADQKGAEWLRYPTPSIETSTQGNGKNSSLLRIDQPLWSGGRITAAIDAAGNRLHASDAALNEAELDLTLKVIAAHIEALRQKARKKFAKDGVEAHEKLLSMIRRRVEQEVSSLTDQRLAESRLYQSVGDQSQVSQALNNALAQLSQLSGKPVADVSDQGVSMLGVSASKDAALSQALGYSPTLRRLIYEEEAANADIDSKRSAYMPQLSFRLQKSMGPGQIPINNAMLVLQAQPGAGLSAGSGVDAAIARRDAAHMAREAAERNINERISLDWNEWVDARVRLDNAIQARAISTEVFESYTRQYVIGRKSWIDVLNSVREATQSQFALEDARAQVISASLRLRAQTGTLTGAESLKTGQDVQTMSETRVEIGQSVQPMPETRAETGQVVLRLKIDEAVSVPLEAVSSAPAEQVTKIEAEEKARQEADVKVARLKAEIEAKEAHVKAGKKTRKKSARIMAGKEFQNQTPIQTAPEINQLNADEKSNTSQETQASVQTESASETRVKP